MAYETKETAAFNLALPYLNRVNAILNNNYVQFKNGNPTMFAINLRQLYRELIPWLYVDKVKQIDQPKEFVDKFKELSKINSKDKEKVWEKLEEIEMMMRVDFKALGMLMPKINDPRFLFGNKQK